MTSTAQMTAELRATDDAVRANGWVAPGLGMPGAPLGLLGSTLNPLSGLATAGLSWFMPLVSFLGDGLTRLQGGDAASVTSGSRDFGDAGGDIAGVADSYRRSAGTQTSGWTGPAATEYRAAAAEHADGIAGLGQASTTTASAILGAGQVVAQAIAEITELIAEAVSQIVPIMTQAIARAGETFGESVVEAIPPCVGIAVEYAVRIAGKLAALVASGDNLMKLVQGGMAVVDLINTALSSISQQGVRADASAAVTANAGPARSGDVASAMAAIAPNGDPGAAPVPSGGGSDVDGWSPSGSPATPAGSWATGTRSAGVTPLAPDAARPTGVTPTAAQSAGAPPAGAPSMGLAAGGVSGGFPVGAGHPGRDEDKEHQRKYGLAVDHEDDYVVAPEVIGD